ncbi:hypothetical protein L195_g029808, partial [Trifolium pratense]
MKNTMVSSITNHHHLSDPKVHIVKFYKFVDPYGGPPQQWQHNAHPPSDHLVSTIPKPPPPAPIPSRPPSHVAPPPPPFINSSGGSGSNYSGGELLTPPSPG